jgi:3-phenylpropionate/trans-cinnamate dioxygenase ferredoxin component
MSSGWVDVGSSAALRENAPLTAEVEGAAVVIVRCEDGTLCAVEDRCTHDGEPLGEAAVEDCRIICPRHGAQFCLKSGEALTPPAYEPLRTYQVRERDGRIEVECLA